MKILQSSLLRIGSVLLCLLAHKSEATEARYKPTLEINYSSSFGHQSTNELLRTDPLFRHHFYGLMRMRYGTGMIGLWSIKKIRQEALNYVELDRLRNNGRPSRKWIPTPSAGVPQTVRIEYERRYNPQTKEVEWAVVEYPLVGKFRTPRVFFE